MSRPLGFILITLIIKCSITFGQTPTISSNTISKPSFQLRQQQTAFMNHQYPYPGKTKSMWELGVAGGLSYIASDIKAKPFIGGGITLRRALSHTFSLRAGYFGSYSKGSPSDEQKQLGRKPYINRTHSGGLDLIASLNTNSPYRGNPKSNIYLLMGLNLIATEVFFSSPGQPRAVHYDGTYAVFYGAKEENTLDGTLGTFGGNRYPNGNGRESWTVIGGASAGAGFAIKFSKRVNLALEQRFTFLPYDYLDAVKTGNHNDFYSFTSGRINYNIGRAAKRTEPLWWINRNNYVYNEVNRPEHMSIEKHPLPDADGDGVTDQFDRDANTPAGVPVDARGVGRDTDGDGVPDYRDKELLTTQNCFPVDADGIGNCPELPCCTELHALIAGTEPAKTTCGLTLLPKIHFASGKATLSEKAMALLSTAAEKIKNAPACKIKITGYGISDKNTQQLTFRRAKVTADYMTEKLGINENRLILVYEEAGEKDTIDLTPASE